MLRLHRITALCGLKKECLFQLNDMKIIYKDKAMDTIIEYNVYPIISNLGPSVCSLKGFILLDRIFEQTVRNVKDTQYDHFIC